MVLSPSYHRVFTIVPSRFHDRIIAFSPPFHRVFTIVTSRFCLLSIAFSPSYHRVFNIVPSRFHHRTIVISPSCHRLPVDMRNNTFLFKMFAFSLLNPAPFLFAYL
jgi:hypothetical protein